MAELGRAVDRVLEALDLDADAKAYDAWLDPLALADALEAGEDRVLVRVGVELTTPEAGYASLPEDPVFLLVARDACVRVGAFSEPVRRETALKVVVDAVDEPCCASAKCTAHKRVHSVSLQLKDCASLLVCESLEPKGAARAAAALARRLHVVLEGAEAPKVANGTPTTPLSAHALARWTLRREGELFVLRDHASHGPREAASREWLAAAALLVGGGAAWFVASVAYRDQNHQSLAIAAAVAIVLTLAAWAMSRIAAHSGRYVARTEALFYAARNRFVVAPWLSRKGAVNPKPEGRYGAALRPDELVNIEVVPERDGFTLRANSSHGPIDIGTLESEAQAKTWRAVLVRLVQRVSHASAFLLAVLAALGCGAPTTTLPLAHPPSGSVATEEPAAQSPAAQSHATQEPAPEASRPAPKTAALTIIEDDVPKAMAAAKGSGRALFVEVWAPWCHTCLSMKNFVLPDPSIAALGGRVVFAAIDSDLPVNVAFMDRYSVSVWPTLYVLDATDGSVIGLWQGGASVKELHKFILTAIDGRDAKLDPTRALVALLDAKRAHASAKWKHAADSYQHALDRGGASWNRRNEAIAGLQFSMYRIGNWSRCAQLGADHVGRMAGAALPADFAWVTLRCAASLPDGTLKQRARQRAVARLRHHTRVPPPTASADDRSDALSILAAALRESGDTRGARIAVERQITILEAAAAAAPGAAEAATFDYARMNAYLSVGRGDEAVAMLGERAKQLPDSYEVPARLAQALMALDRHAEAKVPLAVAVRKSYGPRQLRYISMQAKLHRKLGDKIGEKGALKRLLAAYEELSPKQRAHPPTKEVVESTKKRLAVL